MEANPNNQNAGAQKQGDSPKFTLGRTSQAQSSKPMPQHPGDKNKSQNISQRNTEFPSNQMRSFNPGSMASGSGLSKGDQLSQNSSTSSQNNFQGVGRKQTGTSSMQSCSLNNLQGNQFTNGANNIQNANQTSDQASGKKRKYAYPENEDQLDKIIQQRHQDQQLVAQNNKRLKLNADFKSEMAKVKETLNKISPRSRSSNLTRTPSTANLINSGTSNSNLHHQQNFNSQSANGQPQNFQSDQGDNCQNKLTVNNQDQIQSSRPNRNPYDSPDKQFGSAQNISQKRSSSGSLHGQAQTKGQHSSNPLPQHQNVDMEDESLDFDALEGLIGLTPSLTPASDKKKLSFGNDITITSTLLRQIQEDDDEEEEEKKQQPHIQNFDSGLSSHDAQFRESASRPQNPDIEQANQGDDQSVIELNQIEDSKFSNCCFRIEVLTQSRQMQIDLELSLAETEKRYPCSLRFRLVLIGSWGTRLFAERGDMVRVIGTFCSDNNFQLKLTDNELDPDLSKASLLIVEPHILIPSTSISLAFPCVRNAELKYQFKGLSGDINYALVLGNTIHNVFQSILQTMQFNRNAIQETVKEAIQEQLLSLYYLEKTEAEVERDVERAVNNITKWLGMLIKGDYNQHGIKYRKFIAAEQEFNSHTFGIKGNIDSTIIIEKSDGSLKSTALEIKTGRSKKTEYRAQVLLYSLLISERFLNANPENILLYIMDDDVKNGFEYIKKSKAELDNIIRGRNELAKWQKINSMNIYNNLVIPQGVRTALSQEELTSLLDQVNQQQVNIEDLSRDHKSLVEKQIDSLEDIVRYPPMIKQTMHCSKACYTRTTCSMLALSVEKPESRQAPMGHFSAFLDLEKNLNPKVKAYFKKFIECIQLEQNLETQRKNQTLKNSFSGNRETGLMISKFESNKKGGTIVTLEKEINLSGTGNDNLTDDERVKQCLEKGLQENSSVSLSTIDNISFSRGVLIKKEIDFKFKSISNTPLKEESCQIVEVSSSDQNIQSEQRARMIEQQNLESANFNKSFENSMTISDLDFKLLNMSNYFRQYLIYTVEFSQLMPQNFSSDALGGRKIKNDQDIQKQLQWTIESEPFSNSSFQLMRSNVLALCTDPRFERLKQLIVLEQPPQDISNEDIKRFIKVFGLQMKGLNEDQMVAVAKAYICKDYHIIKGVPGSGKSQVIQTLIRILSSQGKKVLVVNSTHTLIDSLLVKLKKSGFEKFVKLSNNLSGADPLIRDKLVCSDQFKSMEDIRNFVQSTNVYAMTCLSMSNQILLAVKRFDYCIIDDASLISEPQALGPLLLCDRFVMAGDYLQHGVQVKSFIAERKGLGQSLFERICKLNEAQSSKAYLSMLTQSYLMGPHMAELHNKLTYQGLIKSSNQIDMSQRLSDEQDNLTLESEFKQIVRANQVAFLQTDELLQTVHIEKRQGKESSQNFLEMSIVKTLLKEFASCKEQNNSDQSTIALITPTSDYLSYLLKELKKDAPQSTEAEQDSNSRQFKLYDYALSVEKSSQNFDCDIVIFSCGLWSEGCDKIDNLSSSLNNPSQQSEESKAPVVISPQKQAIKDLKRLNYMLTRAKKKLIVIGSSENLKRHKPLKSLLLACKMKSWYRDLTKEDLNLICKEFTPEIQL